MLQIQIRRLRSTNAELSRHFGRQDLLHLRTTLLIDPPADSIAAAQPPPLKIWPNMVVVDRDGVALPGGCQWAELPAGARHRPWQASFEYPLVAVHGAAAAAAYDVDSTQGDGSRLQISARLVFKLKRPASGSSGSRGGGGRMSCGGAG